MIRLTVPSLDQSDFAAVEAVLKSGYLVQGPQVAAFEHEIARVSQTSKAIAVTNCTAALQMALLALDVQSRDLILVTAYSWVSTANVIELCGAQPIFVDIDPDTFNMCPLALEQVLNRLMQNPAMKARVKTIMPVHTFGQMADMPRILELANSYNIPVIEDAACALAAKFEGQPAGSWGIMGCFSFHPRKAITTGEGGAITTSNNELTWKLKVLRNHGQDPDADGPDFVLPSFNNRMTEFQGALGLNQMTKLERIVKARQDAARVYDDLLRDSFLQSPQVSKNSEHVYQSYVTLLPVQYAHQRSSLIETLKTRGIETSIGTWHMPLTRYYRSRYGYTEGNFPIADQVFARALTLPLFEGITLEQQHSVVSNILEILEHD